MQIEPPSGVRSRRLFFFFKQKTAYEIPKRDWSSDVCSSDLLPRRQRRILLAEVRVDDEGAGRDGVIREVDQDVKPVRGALVDDLGGRQVEGRRIDGASQQRFGARRRALGDEHHVRLDPWL